MVAGYHVDCGVQTLRATPLCAVKSSFKTGLHISLSRDQSYGLPFFFIQKLVCTLQIEDHFFLNLNSDWGKKGGKKGAGLVGERSGGERCSNLSKSCSYSKTNKNAFSEEFLVILFVGYKEKIV